MASTALPGTTMPASAAVEAGMAEENAGRLRRVATAWGRAPEIDATACVHAYAVAASCRACVDACPAGAWHLDSDALRLDTAACNGCGLCAAACPQAAIETTPRLALRRAGDGTVIGLAACRESGIHSGPGRLPCLKALSGRDLLWAAARGMTRLVTSRGDCTACALGAADPGTGGLHALVSGVAAVTRDHGGPPPRLVELSTDAFHTLQHETEPPPAAGPRVGRRRLLGRLLGEAAASGRFPGSSLAADAGPDRRPPAHHLADRRPGGLLPWIIRLEASRCTACHACVRLCPGGAILHRGGDSPAYVLDHAACTGCNLCRDACPSDAIAPHPWRRPDTARVELEARRCPRCGAPFEQPVEREADDGHCAICRSRRPEQKLFHVFPD